MYSLGKLLQYVVPTQMNFTVVLVWDQVSELLQAIGTKYLSYYKPLQQRISDHYKPLHKKVQKHKKAKKGQKPRIVQLI